MWKMGPSLGRLAACINFLVTFTTFVVSQVVYALVALGAALYRLWACVYEIMCPHENSILGVFQQIQNVIYIGFGLAIYDAIILKATKTAEILTALNGFVTTYAGRPHFSPRTATVRFPQA